MATFSVLAASPLAGGIPNTALFVGPGLSSLIVLGAVAIVSALLWYLNGLASGFFSPTQPRRPTARPRAKHDATRREWYRTAA